MTNGCAQIEGNWNGAAGEALLQQPAWYAIRTRSRHEKKVSQQLEQQGIETFLPLIKRTRKWSDRTKEVRSEEHTSELQSRLHLVCRLLLEKNKHAGESTRRGATALAQDYAE